MTRLWTVAAFLIAALFFAQNSYAQDDPELPALPDLRLEPPGFPGL